MFIIFSTRGPCISPSPDTLSSLSRWPTPHIRHKQRPHGHTRTHSPPVPLFSHATRGVRTAHRPHDAPAGNTRPLATPRLEVSLPARSTTSPLCLRSVSKHAIHQGGALRAPLPCSLARAGRGRAHAPPRPIARSHGLSPGCGTSAQRSALPKAAPTLLTDGRTQPRPRRRPRRGPCGRVSKVPPICLHPPRPPECSAVRRRVWALAPPGWP